MKYFLIQLFTSQIAIIWSGAMRSYLMHGKLENPGGEAGHFSTSRPQDYHI